MIGGCRTTRAQERLAQGVAAGALTMLGEGTEPAAGIPPKRCTNVVLRPVSAAAPVRQGSDWRALDRLVSASLVEAAAIAVTMFNPGFICGVQLATLGDPRLGGEPGRVGHLGEVVRTPPTVCAESPPAGCHSAGTLDTDHR